MTISIITVLYHSENHLHNFLTSIDRISERVKLLMYDNTYHNIGLSKAVNKMIQETVGDIIILANPDVIFDEQVEGLIEYVRRYPQHGAVPIFIEHDGARRYPTLIRILVTITTLGKWLGKPIKIEYDKVQSNRVEQPGGSFLVMSKLLVDRFLKQDGYLYDEHFPIFWNDVDMAMRARERGISFMRFPIRIHHSSGHSFKTLSYERKCMLYYSKAGLIGFAQKWNMYPRIIQTILFFDAITAIIVRLIGRLRHGGDFRSTLLKFRATLH